VLKTMFVGVLIAASGLVLFAPTSHSESVSKFVTKEEKIRADMLTISRHLGVTCNECHSVSNFTDATKPNFKISKEHMKIMQVLKDNGFDGKKGPEATCYMCHRGKLHPDFKEPAASVAK
jgi:hypothetical protein